MFPFGFPVLNKALDFKSHKQKKIRKKVTGLS